MLEVFFRSYAFQRALTAAAVFLSLLFGAWVIPQSEYAQILLAMFLAKFLQIANLGATNGYFVSYYGQTAMFQTESHEAEHRFCLYLLLQLVSIFVPAALLSVYLFPKYTMGIAAFVLLIPIYVLEPVFRRRRRFYMSLVPDILMAASLTATGLIAHFVHESFASFASPAATFMVSLAALVGVLYVMLMLKYGRSAQPFKRISLRQKRDYGRLIALGLPVYLGTTLFMLASGLDRFLLPMYADDKSIAVYMLSYQIATGAMIFLASVNFVNTIDFGQAFQSGEPLRSDLLVRKLSMSVGLAGLSVGAIYLASLALERFFLVDYQNLTRISVTLAAGLSFFFIAGSVTPVLAYLRKQTNLTILMGLCATVILLNNIVSIYLGWGIVWLSTVTAVVIGLYGMVALVYTFAVAAAAAR